MDVVTGVFASLFSFMLPGAIMDESADFSGYLEGDYVYVAPVISGRITKLPISEGDTIAAGAAVVTLDGAKYVAARDAAKAQVEAAQATLDNLKQGSRDAEIDAIVASLETARADLSLASSDTTRARQLASRGVISDAALDSQLATLKSAKAQVEQLEANLTVARLPVGRPGEIAAAEANLRAAEADLASAEANLGDTELASPASGHVEDVYFSPGEMVAAGTPVVQILPDGALKVVFFVPEARRPDIDAGGKLRISCDGCPSGLEAQITTIASEPEYTPPVIYSRSQRQKLSYRAEARFDDAVALAPGQPIEAELRP